MHAPQRRATAQDCLKHPWLQDEKEEEEEEEEEGRVDLGTIAVAVADGKDNEVGGVGGDAV